jgi:hypothetical protein
MLKNIFLFFLLTIPSKVFFGQSIANAIASANIVNPVGTEKTADLDFGTFSAGSNAGSVILNASGEHKNTGGIKLNDTQQKSSTASLRIMNGNYSFGVLLEAVPLNLTQVNGKQIIRIGDFKASASQNNFLENHYSILSIAATLNIEPGNSAGLYTTDKPLHIIVNFE